MKNELIDEEYGEIVEIDNSAFEESLEEEPETNDEPVVNGQGKGFNVFFFQISDFLILYFWNVRFLNF